MDCMGFARRVGKSTIAEEFAKREYASYIKVDFADAPDAVWEAVAHIADRDQFFQGLFHTPHYLTDSFVSVNFLLFLTVER